MDEVRAKNSGAAKGGVDSRETAGGALSSGRRSSLAGMFPFLQKQQSMDTDSSDRHQRRSMGGKVKPGKQHSRTSSGDVSDSLTPGPGDAGSSAWHAAAGHDSSSTTPLGWPSNSPAPSTSTSTPSRGLFSKLLSGKKKHKGTHSPTLVAVPDSPPLASRSLGASSNSSQSPKSHSAEQLADHTIHVGAYGRSSSGSGHGACLPTTPPNRHSGAADAERGGDDEGDYDSCYSTPAGSEAMLSPHQDYGGDTLDLRHMVYDAHGDKSPMPMRQDLPEVFTPGFNELLQQAGGRLQQEEPDTPHVAGAHEEPTVALLTCDQLAQAGRMYDASAMLLGPIDAQQQQQRQGSAPAACSSSRCISSMAAGSKAVSRASSAVSSPKPTQPQQPAGTAADSPCSAPVPGHSSEHQPLCAEDIELHVAAAGADVDVEVPAAAAAAEEQSGHTSPTPSRESAADVKEVASAAVLAEPAGAATQPAAGGAEDCSTATAVVQMPLSEDSTPAAAAASTEDCSGTADNAQPDLLKAAEPSCSAAEEPAATDKQQQPEAVQESAEESGAVSASSSRCSSVEAQPPAEDVEQAAAAAVRTSRELPTAESAAAETAEAAVSPTAQAAPLPISVPQDAEPATEPAAEPEAEPAAEPEAEAETEPAAEPKAETAAEPAAETETEPAAEPEAETAKKPAAEPAAETKTEPAAKPEAESSAEPEAEAATEPAAEPETETATEPADSDTGMAAAATAAAAAAAAGGMLAAAQEQVESAAAFRAAAAVVGGEPDEFALLEQQVIAEVEAEVAADEFALLERQVAAEDAEEVAVDEFALLEQQVAAEEAEAEEFAKLERLAATDASAHAVAAEGSSGSMPLMPVTEGAEGDEPALAAEASDLPEGACRPSAAGSDGSPVLGLSSSARRAARRSPISSVRESMPLFLADPSRAMGSPLALQPGDESLDDQDMQQLSAGNAYRGSSGATRLLSHGGPQRVSLGLAGGSSFLSSLEPVEESSFTSAGSPIPEGSPSFANQHNMADSPESDAGGSSAAAGAPGDMSPLYPRRLSSSSSRAADAAAAGQVTPCFTAADPNLATTPGSTYSTPTLAFGAPGQDRVTPQSNVSSAIGSAIRASGAVAGPLELSPAMPDSMPQASPTLMLMPGQGFDSTVGLQGVDGSTPSLLDARAASPSAVYATRFTATPFRGALAALPMDAALAAPLLDSSPFSLREEHCGLDTVCLADEAQRVAANLAAAAAGAYSPSQAVTPKHVRQQAGTPGSAAADGRAASPTEELRDLQLVMLTRQLAELQKRNKELEAEADRLKEQVEMYEFEKTELNSQEEMERQARQYAEEQLQAMQVEVQQLMQAKAGQASQMLALRQEFEAIQRDAQERHNANRAAHEHMAAENAKLQDEHNRVLDQLNMQDMQITALKSNNNQLMHAVEGEQQRCAELEAKVAACERDLAEADRVKAEFQAKVEKMMGQVIAADTNKEHYRQKAADEAARVQQMMTQQQQVMAERQQLLAEREKRAQDHQHLKQKYAHKSATLKEYEAKLQAKDAENQELLTMCDQLLQQQEARKT